MPVAVFDIDDTICTTKNRDYPNSEPIQDVIDKIKLMKSMGWTIRLHTSRGVASCKGDMKLILERNKDVLETWLAEHEVPYDELIFGKPLADLYVDDKAMNVNDFITAPIGSFYGTSGSDIQRLGDKIIKRASNAKEQYDWYKYVERNHIDGKYFKIPKMYSFTVDTTIMEYVKGTVGSDIVDEQLLNKVVNMCKYFSTIDKGKNDVDVDSYCDYLIGCCTSDWLMPYIKDVVNYLQSNASLIKSNSSFSHGDLTLNNLIVKDQDIYLIDSNPKPTFSTWIADVAKIRYSLNGYDREFGYTEYDLSKYLDYFDSLLPQNLLPLIRVLEISRWIRILPFIKKNAPDKLNFVENKISHLVVKELTNHYDE